MTGPARRASPIEVLRALRTADWFDRTVFAAGLLALASMTGVDGIDAAGRMTEDGDYSRPHTLPITIALVGAALWCTPGLASALERVVAAATGDSSDPRLCASVGRAGVLDPQPNVVSPCSRSIQRSSS